MQTVKLIEQLVEQTKDSIHQIEKLKMLGSQDLTWKIDEHSWNILECVEHLNLYGDYYLPLIEKNINSSSSQSETEFKSGILGNYFAQSMLPKTKLNKMKTFKDKNPINANLNVTVLDRFIHQQKHLLELLNASKKVSLSKVKIGVSIAPFIKIKLGETFQFFSNHIIRHLKQIENIQLAQKTISKTMGI